MSESLLLTAILNGKKVQINGGFKHPEKGHHVEIFDGNSRRSIKIWDLSHHSDGTAKYIFHELFSTSPERAMKIDKVKGLDEKLLTIKIKEPETAIG
ncbi:hypothetical protein GW920_00070 [Candidatus Falkowbacteria bacterium]|uniref:Uncharacterized protein n=1 Tax=Candidatus Falkowbacteria bacterium CG10_big_fil_rev_8_21_14_0_10_37_18 TaxID=1974562 RepID=A0A2H0V8H1_9BACT|nr:hypothetical protein [Candidatus Falkowbacteria bacterium]NCQ12999.1 hypothetical protein [Candidatus Falkowbacteria bacterium]OIO06574.1 MAG: hypothetical protein AUJ26_00365 [Candidatus Falkowbacteria bacterium CG1_02_37_21]PIR95373.1 MAG: hypothetical protein COT93_02675 [Candidatus Falkowbacteria bacterium CG10_big_fil_rev_8_21_14_0_10_37_18]